MKEEFLAVVETKRHLGREFLTWLVHRIEEEGTKLDVEGEVVEVTLGDRVLLAGGGESPARLTIFDEGDLRLELGAGLQRGKLIDRAQLSINRGERTFELTFDGGLYTFDALRPPKLGPRDDSLKDDPRAAMENDLFLRLADIEEVAGIFDRLFAEFARLRVSPAWEEAALPELRRWVAELGE
jgi:hypothetical protein